MQSAASIWRFILAHPVAAMALTVVGASAAGATGPLLALWQDTHSHATATGAVLLPTRAGTQPAEQAPAPRDGPVPWPTDAAPDTNDAGVMAVTALLDRDDATADPTALAEALRMLQREWNRPEVLASGLLQRVRARPCPADPQLRAFWLCALGD